MSFSFIEADNWVGRTFMGPSVAKWLQEKERVIRKTADPVNTDGDASVSDAWYVKMPKNWVYYTVATPAAAFPNFVREVEYSLWGKTPLNVLDSGTAFAPVDTTSFSAEFGAHLDTLNSDFNVPAKYLTSWTGRFSRRDYTYDRYVGRDINLGFDIQTLILDSGIYRDVYPTYRQTPLFKNRNLLAFVFIDPARTVIRFPSFVVGQLDGWKPAEGLGSTTKNVIRPIFRGAEFCMVDAPAYIADQLVSTKLRITPTNNRMREEGYVSAYSPSVISHGMGVDGTWKTFIEPLFLTTSYDYNWGTEEYVKMNGSNFRHEFVQYGSTYRLDAVRLLGSRTGIPFMESSGWAALGHGKRYVEMCPGSWGAARATNPVTGVTDYVNMAFNPPGSTPHDYYSLSGGFDTTFDIFSQEIGFGLRASEEYLKGAKEEKRTKFTTGYSVSWQGIRYDNQTVHNPIQYVATNTSSAEMQKSWEISLELNKARWFWSLFGENQPEVRFMPTLSYGRQRTVAADGSQRGNFEFWKITVPFLTLSKPLNRKRRESLADLQEKASTAESQINTVRASVAEKEAAVTQAETALITANLAAQEQNHRDLTPAEKAPLRATIQTAREAVTTQKEVSRGQDAVLGQTMYFGRLARAAELERSAARDGNRIVGNNYEMLLDYYSVDKEAGQLRKELKDATDPYLAAVDCLVRKFGLTDAEAVEIRKLISDEIESIGRKIEEFITYAREYGVNDPEAQTKRMAVANATKDLDTRLSEEVKKLFALKLNKLFKDQYPAISADIATVAPAVAAQPATQTQPATPALPSMIKAENPDPVIDQAVAGLLAGFSGNPQLYLTEDKPLFDNFVATQKEALRGYVFALLFAVNESLCADDATTAWEKLNDYLKNKLPEAIRNLKTLLEGNKNANAEEARRRREAEAARQAQAAATERRKLIDADKNRLIEAFKKALTDRAAEITRCAPSAAAIVKEDFLMKQKPVTDRRTALDRLLAEYDTLADTTRGLRAPLAVAKREAIVRFINQSGGIVDGLVLPLVLADLKNQFQTQFTDELNVQMAEPASSVTNQDLRARLAREFRTRYQTRFDAWLTSIGRTQDVCSTETLRADFLSFREVMKKDAQLLRDQIGAGDYLFLVVNLAIIYRRELRRVIRERGTDLNDTKRAAFTEHMNKRFFETMVDNAQSRQQLETMVLAATQTEEDVTPPPAQNSGSGFLAWVRNVRDRAKNAMKELQALKRRPLTIKTIQQAQGGPLTLTTASRITDPQLKEASELIWSNTDTFIHSLMAESRVDANLVP